VSALLLLLLLLLFVLKTSWSMKLQHLSLHIRQVQLPCRGSGCCQQQLYAEVSEFPTSNSCAAAFHCVQEYLPSDMTKSFYKSMLAVLLLALLLSMAPVQARQLLQQHGAHSTAAVAEDGANTPAATTVETPALDAAVLPAVEAAAADTPASPDGDVTGQHAAAVAAVAFNNVSSNSVHVALEDQFKCFCQPGELLWGCPFFPKADLQNNVKSFLGCLRLSNNWPSRPCGKVRNSDCSTTLVASKTVVT
jgi:hypothetical protein